MIIYILLIGFVVQDSQSSAIQIGGSILFFPLVIMIVVRQKYPKWWFNWMYELTMFTYRISAYSMLLTDKYPSIDEEQDIELTLKYPNAKEELNRYLPLIKWLLALPHLLILSVLGLLLGLLSPVVWVIVLVMGKMPEKLFLEFAH